MSSTTTSHCSGNLSRLLGQRFSCKGVLVAGVIILVARNLSNTCVTSFPPVVAPFDAADDHRLPSSPVDQGRTSVDEHPAPTAVNNSQENASSTPTRPHTTAKATDSNRSFFFVHVGKTGGASVGETILSHCEFKGRQEVIQACQDSFPTEHETQLSKRVIGMKHSRALHPERMKEATTFVWSIRDPMDRLASAFYMATPHNHRSPRTQCQNKKNARTRFATHALFCTCYTHIEDFIQDALVHKSSSNNNNNNNGKIMVHPHNATSVINTLQSSNNDTHFNNPKDFVFQMISEDENALPSNRSVTCPELAWTALSPFKNQYVEMNSYPNSRFSEHMSLNYQHYFLKTLDVFPQKEVMVIRTEHLWSDLQELEVLLNAEEGVSAAAVTVGPSVYETITHGSPNYQVHHHLTDPQLIQTLCCAIRKDVLLYIELIHRATNLSPQQKQESLSALEGRCQLSLCPSLPPVS